MKLELMSDTCNEVQYLTYSMRTLWVGLDDFINWSASGHKQSNISNFNYFVNGSNSLSSGTTVRRRARVR